MATGEESSPLRIGHAERTSAQQALDEHLAAGRLDVDEYADRSAAAANAVVAADLAALFTDLPQPHPELPGGPAAPPPTAPLPMTPPPGEVAPAAKALQNVGGGVLLLAVAIAVGLFLVTRAGPVFLLIPLAAVVLWGVRRR
ncbi:DUF1707 SHOCT-like domain-containing protein [Pseudonocardia adelaidensis]|uniref:DUF1707 domain-containing protein n=1 Tax=Pseudonocardia adelaidensis TaxID=648754 RepID=A0ABP9NC23_9PSEU